MFNKNRIRLAIQKSGRLSDHSKDLLLRCGIKINFNNPSLISVAENLPIDIMLVRDDDIPGLIMDGAIELGIVGSNILQEVCLERKYLKEPYIFTALQNLDFGVCRLSLAVPAELEYLGISSLFGAKIATSYPYLLKRYFKQKGIPFQAFVLNGSVEIATNAGFSDAICDLVSSGVTLKANGLKEVEVIFNSCACLISQNYSNIPINHQNLINKLLERIKGVIKARESKYIMLHIPRKKLQQAINLLNCAEKPTILELAGNTDKVVLHIVSAETIFWDIMEKLKVLGASSILVLPIEKIME